MQLVYSSIFKQDPPIMWLHCRWKPVSFNLALSHINNQGILNFDPSPHHCSKWPWTLEPRDVWEWRAYGAPEFCASCKWLMGFGCSEVEHVSWICGHLMWTIVVVNHWILGYSIGNMIKSRWMECYTFNEPMMKIECSFMCFSLVSFTRTHLVGQVSYTSKAGFGFHWIPPSQDLKAGASILSAGTHFYCSIILLFLASSNNYQHF